MLKAGIVTTRAEVGLYDQRHSDGWMDFWPAYRRKRIVELIRSTGIPSNARVLEYGCGVGVFAEALKRALPALDVHGCDISSVAVARAGKRCSDVRYYLVDSPELERLAGTCDLIYTHHVLEYVVDIPAVLSDMCRLLKPGGKILHIVPCGNPGSLEHKISSLTKAGIDTTGRFCCDDPSHARRLTSDELVAACREQGLALSHAVFANQFWGAVDYLTDTYHWTLLGWLDPLQGASAMAKLKLLLMTVAFGGVSLLRRGPAYIFRMLAKARSVAKRVLALLALPFAICLYPLSLAVDWFLGWQRDREWETGRNAPNGSEMYLLFERDHS